MSLYPKEPLTQRIHKLLNGVVANSGDVLWRVFSTKLTRAVHDNDVDHVKHLLTTHPKSANNVCAAMKKAVEKQHMECFDVLCAFVARDEDTKMFHCDIHYACQIAANHNAIACIPVLLRYATTAECSSAIGSAVYFHQHEFLQAMLDVSSFPHHIWEDALNTCQLYDRKEAAHIVYSRLPDPHILHTLNPDTHNFLAGIVAQHQHQDLSAQLHIDAEQAPKRPRRKI